MKFSSLLMRLALSMSRPARGAWVEIPYPPPLDSRSFLVAPRKGRVG